MNNKFFLNKCRFIFKIKRDFLDLLSAKYVLNKLNLKLKTTHMK